MEGEGTRAYLIRINIFPAAGCAVRATFAATRVETRGITDVRSSQVNYLSCYSEEISDLVTTPRRF